VPDLEANKRTVVDFFDLAVNQKRLDEAMQRCIGPTYTQHNPEIADGRDGLAAFIRELTTQFPDFTVKVIRSMAEGDLVAAHVYATRAPGDRGVVSMDMFRLENGRLVEHWDVIQEIPETAANSNGML
jgi:predicted SnoaL-like aldol condensation-catalyzing enzyme